MLANGGWDLIQRLSVNLTVACLCGKDVDGKQGEAKPLNIDHYSTKIFHFNVSVSSTINKVDTFNDSRKPFKIE